VNRYVTYGDLVVFAVVICGVNVAFAVCSDLIRVWWQRRHPGKEEA
jgi:hypothetical protein